MNRLDRAKKDKVSQFKAITDTTDKVALQCLQASTIPLTIPPWSQAGVFHVAPPWYRHPLLGLHLWLLQG
jgi:hypothetical protein